MTERPEASEAEAAGRPRRVAYMWKRRWVRIAAAFVLLFYIDRWVTDRLVEAHGENWWTMSVGSAPLMIAVVAFLPNLRRRQGSPLLRWLRSRRR